MDEHGPQAVESNPTESDPGKMFVSILHSQTTTDGLQRYFEQFGKVKECMVMQDSVTKLSRGFGFVTFVDPKSVDQVETCGFHVIDGKQVNPERSIPKEPDQYQYKKVFVGGLPPDTTEQDLRDYFESYGKVTEVLLLHDRNTKRLRGFGFVTFETDAAGKNVCETEFHKLKGKTIECKRAQTKEATMLQGGWIGTGFQSSLGNTAAAAGLHGFGYQGPTFGTVYPTNIGNTAAAAGPIGFGLPGYTTSLRNTATAAGPFGFGHQGRGYEPQLGQHSEAQDPFGQIQLRK